MFLFLVAPYLPIPELRFYFASYLLTHLKFLRLKFYASKQQSFRKQHSGVCCRHFALVFYNSEWITRTHGEPLGTKVHQPFLSPDFAEIPESPEYSWADSKQSLCRPYGLHLPQTHAHELQTVPSLYGAKQMSLPSNRTLLDNALSFLNDLFWMIKVFIYTCKEQREIWVLLPLPSPQKTGLWEGNSSLRKAFTLQLFLQRQQIWRADLKPAGCSGSAN